MFSASDYSTAGPGFEKLDFFHSTTPSETVRQEREISNAVKLALVEIDQCKPVLLGLSLARKSPTVATARRRPHQPGREPGARATGANKTAAAEPVEADTSAEWRPAPASNTR
jgi:hypothetical protein